MGDIFDDWKSLCQVLDSLANKLLRTEVINELEKTNNTNTHGIRDTINVFHEAVYNKLREEIQRDISNRTERDDFSGLINCLKDFLNIVEKTYKELKYENIQLNDKVLKLKQKCGMAPLPSEDNPPTQSPKAHKTSSQPHEVINFLSQKKKENNDADNINDEWGQEESEPMMATQNQDKPFKQESAKTISKPPSSLDTSLLQKIVSDMSNSHSKEDQKPLNSCETKRSTKAAEKAADDKDLEDEDTLKQESLIKKSKPSKDQESKCNPRKILKEKESDSEQDWGKEERKDSCFEEDSDSPGFSCNNSENNYRFCTPLDNEKEDRKPTHLFKEAQNSNSMMNQETDDRTHAKKELSDPPKKKISPFMPIDPDFKRKQQEKDKLIKQDIDQKINEIQKQSNLPKESIEISFLDQLEIPRYNYLIKQTEITQDDQPPAPSYSSTKLSLKNSQSASSTKNPHVRREATSRILNLNQELVQEEPSSAFPSQTRPEPSSVENIVIDLETVEKLRSLCE
ncbi:unnamed protein product [Moneuplotes crassus]|uniref:Uncharacterized protein n=1 Tax=Euplotes crassus TaxID=5936 RepID=A0AAD1UAZ2_EUPCR|nr:unnamed protein product [Moneuplotes crassus]